MIFYFYCPHCNFEDTTNKLPKGTIANARFGYEKPIYHYECPKCHNLDSGYMLLSDTKIYDSFEEDEKRYMRGVIGLYQNIRGFKG